MKAKTPPILVLTLIFALLLCSAVSANDTKVTMTDVQVPFIENQGQTDSSVNYYADTYYGTAYVTEDGITHSVTMDNTSSVALKEQFLDENSNPIMTDPQGEEQSPTNVNYFIGNDENQWETNLNTYQLVNLGEIYPGITVKVQANGGNLEKLFYLEPGSDVDDILVQILGTNSLQILEDGTLVINTDAGVINMTAPKAYQGEQAINVSYRILSKNTYGFTIGEYDHSKELVIDPTLEYSTYLGGSGTDYGYGIVTDNAGNVYITGYTTSTNFPTTSGAFQTTNSSGDDVFVSKLNPTGTGLLYSTYLGGNGTDRGSEITVDNTGNAFITGYTTSTNFPITTSALQTTFGGGTSDAFVIKLNSEGSSLAYSTYIGGETVERACGIALDDAGNAFITGYTNSTNFPITNGAYQTSNAGSYEIFISKLNSDCTSMVYSTYLGGTGDDRGEDIVLDNEGNIYIAGRSRSANFPTTNGAYQINNNGDYDITLCKLNPTGTTLVYSTYIGGGNGEYVNSLDIDSVGDVYFTGRTRSTNYPTTSGAYQTTHTSNDEDIYVTKINHDGSSLVYSTYLGGSENDQGYGIAVDNSGNTYITGVTYSTNFPVTTDAYQTTKSYGNDVILSKLNSSGNLIYSTFLGGSGSEDCGQSIIIDTSGNIYITGNTNSGDLPITSGVLQTNNASSYDAFIAKFSFTSAPVVDFTSDVTTGTAPLTVQFTESSNNSPTSWLWEYDMGSGWTTFASGSDSAAQNPLYTFTTSGTYSVRLTASNAGGSDDETKTSYITVNALPQIDLTISGLVNTVPASAVFAKEPNAVKVTNVKNNGTDTATNIVVKIYASDVDSGNTAIAETTIPSLAGGATTTLDLIDPTIRNLEGGTVTYTAKVDPDNLIIETNETNNNKSSTAKPLKYNGYKGKRYWDSGSDITTKQTYDIRGDIIYYTQTSSAYKGVGWTTRTETWTATDLPIPAGATVEKALLFFSYNWDQTEGGYPNLITTFNGNSITLGTPYRDWSNFGTYADYEYGLYPAVDVTSLFVKNGDNTLITNPGNAGADNKVALYPSTLAIIYSDPTMTRKVIYINEECDELGVSASSYATTLEEATAYATFNGVDTNNVQSATLHSFAGSAGPDEGNLIFNGNTIAQATTPGSAWQGNSSTASALVANVTSYLTTNNEAGIQGTTSGGMDALQQILVIEYAETTPVAQFTATPTSGNTPLQVTFTNQSTGTITSYAWDFDNNGTTDSNDPNPTWTYSTAGTYTVKLTATGPGGSDDEIKTDYMTVNQPVPVADFIGTSTSGTSPLTVAFTDQSTNANSYTWDFNNDGTVDSTDQNPTWIYDHPGTYTVKLNVTGPGGIDEETKADYIIVSKSTQSDLLAMEMKVTNSPYLNYSLVEVTITNIGLKTAGYFDVTLYDNGTQVKQQYALWLASDAFRTLSFIWSPNMIGEHHLEVVIDQNNSIQESNENNNQITLLVDNRPDLTPTEIKGKTIPFNYCYVTVDVTNNGKDLTEFYDVTLYDNGTQLGQQKIYGLRTGETKTVTFLCKLTSASTHNLQATTDATSTIPETDETNNTLTKQL